MTRSFLKKTLLAVIAALSASFAGAQPVAVGSLSNFDIWNYTGQTVNDFEIIMDGILPSDLIGFYTGNYPNVTVTQIGAATTVVRWSGSSTVNGGFAHFGVNMSRLPFRVRYTWTYDGVPVADVPGSWQGWVWLPGGQQEWRDVLTNQSQELIFVQRRWRVWNGTILDLGQLMRGSPMWNSGILIDTAPIPVPPQQAVLFDIPIPASNPNAFAVMMYDQFDTQNRRIATFLNATNDRHTNAKIGTGSRNSDVKKKSAKAKAKARK